MTIGLEEAMLLFMSFFVFMEKPNTFFARLFKLQPAMT